MIYIKDLSIFITSDFFEMKLWNEETIELIEEYDFSKIYS
jgi:hypothetical protein